MFKIILLSFTLFIAMPVQAAETPRYIKNAVPGAGIVGSGRLTYMFWDVYDATLFAPSGAFDPQKPFALRLEYLRSLKGRAIADTSAEEIRKQGFADEVRLAAWHEQMTRIFPSVQEGSVLTGIYTPGKGTSFYGGGQKIGTIKDEEFGLYFFNIWLGPQTPAPSLRRALIGS
jgi:hypothetical protein